MLTSMLVFFPLLMRTRPRCFLLPTLAKSVCSLLRLISFCSLIEFARLSHTTAMAARAHGLADRNPGCGSSCAEGKRAYSIRFRALANLYRAELEFVPKLGRIRGSARVRLDVLASSSLRRAGSLELGSLTGLINDSWIHVTDVWINEDTEEHVLPCFVTVQTFGLKSTRDTIFRDLSDNNLGGSIPDSLPTLPTLRLLNLSGNQLNGPFPDSICKNHTAALVVGISYEPDMCDSKRKSLSRKRAAIITVSVVVPGLIVAALIFAYSILREKRKPKGRRYENAPGCSKSDGEHLKNSENRRFTYKELDKLTNNFSRLVGHGGFGLVYYGCLEDNTEVAVKMRSESSSHGLDEFLAEVQSLTKVHHRNLVSLVGYCWEDDHLALVYEYMPQGNLFVHLRGRNGVAETLNWETRVQVVLEAAQGLEYLHKGCSLPIIHRDVKTSNILLDQNLQAKLADFGLCKTYLSDSQTHISATAAGSTGYIDPEYYHTGWLTESSDVYSFGVVLLEVATGEPPLVPGHGHIVQRVKQMIPTGDITFIADARLRGVYDINSMWKVVDTAIMCTVLLKGQLCPPWWRC